MKRKYTIESMKESMKSEGYTLVSKEYSSVKKLECVCNKGHVFHILSHNWNKGKRCPVCYNQVRGKKAAKDFESIRESFDREGYILLSSKLYYKNNKTKLEYTCPNGHKHNISWTKWQQNRRCPSCAPNSRVKYLEVKEAFEKEGYILLTGNYNYHMKLRYKCDIGHEHETVWGHWQQGKRCPTCFRIRMTGSSHPQWKGGISFEPYCEIWKDSEYKQDIRDRDGNKCLNPDCWERDKRLHVHHIDYNKKNCEPKNLITLCGSCNSRANKDRVWHKSWYQAIIKNRYYREA